MKYKQKLQRITASKSWLFEKVSKTDRPWPQQPPKKDMHQINKVRNEQRHTQQRPETFRLL